MDCRFVTWCALTSAEQAAWVQSVGSVLAIAAAVWISSTQHRRETRKRTRATRQLMNYALAALRTEAAKAKEIAGTKNFKKLDAETIGAARKALDSIRLDDIPDYRLIPNITITSEMLRLAGGLIKTINDAGQSGIDAVPTIGTSFNAILSKVEEYAIEVRQIDHDNSGWLYRIVNKRPD